NHGFKWRDSKTSCYSWSDTVSEGRIDHSLPVIQAKFLTAGNKRECEAFWGRGLLNGSGGTAFTAQGENGAVTQINSGGF
ncbi:uncharacterized protein METZ01_LOCUS163195, partial [marine metagenome]